MTNLIPEQRHDRNGKLVTRHVKHEGHLSSSMTSVPAPKLPSAAKDSLTAGVRLVPSQERIKRRDASGYPVTYKDDAAAFDASDVEMYGVLSVAPPATALRLLAGGVRSAEEAVERLAAEGREDELLDNAGVAHQMLLRRVSAEFYVMGLERLSDEQLRSADPELLADYSEFFAIRSIMRKDSPQIADEVLSGEISLSDVREVGIDNLKTGNRLETARPAFKELKNGTAKFTVQDLSKALHQRNPYDVAAEVGYMVRYGTEAIHQLRRLGVGVFGGMTIGEMASTLNPYVRVPQEELFSIINYTGRLVEASDMVFDTTSYNKVREVLEKGKFLHDAGVDVQYAAERIHDEDTQVIVATFNGAHKSMSSGWL